MRVTFLGTSGAVPTVQRNPSGIHVEREGERFLFDCGEGTQRQMMRYSAGFDVEHVFLSHLHGDHVLGLPGLTQTWDFNDRDTPLSVHAPAGTRDRVEGLIGATGERPSYPVRVHQVRPGDVALSREEYEIRTIDVEHRTNAVGYTFVEGDRKGEFDRQKAEAEYGLPPGPKYSKLHDGSAVEHDGETIEPSDVVGDPRPGRTVVYTGDTRPCAAVRNAAEGADLLIHDSMFGSDHHERAVETGHSTAHEAAELACDAGVERLALTHISSRYAGGGWHDLESEAAEVAGEGRVFVADDGMCAEIPYADADREFVLERTRR